MLSLLVSLLNFFTLTVRRKGNEEKLTGNKVTELTHKKIGIV